jgi:ParB family chromosome partitioning protein
LGIPFRRKFIQLIINILKLIIMKTNKKVQKNNVQKSEKETAVKVTALAIIPKPIILLSPQNVPTATEVTETPETANVPTITEEAPQQATFKTPLATATAETDLDITTVHPSADNHRKTFNDASLRELAESIREVGVLQAIAVRPHTAGGYEIIYGERRYRASLLAGAKTIKATIYNNITDDEAEDMSLSENLQREEVRPTEEAKAFKRLLEKGRYDMYSLVSRFGRSEKYIYTRLKLNELYQPIGELLDNETITISVAEEISTYEPNIQKDVYEKHLKEDSRDNWAGYTLKLFKKYFEEYYTTDLEQYKFDKTECKACVHNAANYNLFAEHNGCGHCTNRKCLDTKNAAFVAKETEKLLKSDPKLVIARPYYGGMNETALQKLDKKGHEIKELNYTVSAQSFPKAPEAPRQEQFSKPKEYEQAVQTFEQKNEEYARKVEELNRKKEEGRIKTYVKVGQTEPELCYVEINKKETAPVTVETLQERDKRFKQLSVEKIVADTKKVVRENDYPESPFTQYEDGMMYFIMLTKLQRKHYPLCGIKDQPIRLDEKQQMKIVAKLTDAQKTVIKRDFINYFLCEDAYGDNSASKLLRDFANMHFPDQYGLAKATHEEEYQKRHERLDERIKEMKKAEKAAAKKDEKQNVSPALPNDDKAA